MIRSLHVHASASFCVFVASQNKNEIVLGVRADRALNYRGCCATSMVARSRTSFWLCSRNVSGCFFLSFIYLFIYFGGKLLIGIADV